MTQTNLTVNLCADEFKRAESLIKECGMILTSRVIKMQDHTNYKKKKMMM